MITAVAHHQAGHAVAAWALGLPLAKVTIPVHDETVGGCSYQGWPRWFRPDVTLFAQHRQQAERHITSMLAGPEAERRHRAEAGPVDDQALADNARHDYDSATDLVTYLAEDTANYEALLARLRAGTSALVEEHWAAVVSLAEQLLSHREMTGSWVNAYLDTLP
jgi:hypothetical protein